LISTRRRIDAIWQAMLPNWRAMLHRLHACWTHLKGCWVRLNSNLVERTGVLMPTYRCIDINWHGVYIHVQVHWYPRTWVLCLRTGDLILAYSLLYTTYRRIDRLVQAWVYGWKFYRWDIYVNTSFGLESFGHIIYNYFSNY